MDKEIHFKTTVEGPQTSILPFVLKAIKASLNNGYIITGAQIDAALNYIGYNSADNTVEFPMRIHDLHGMFHWFPATDEHFYFI